MENLAELKSVLENLINKVEGIEQREKSAYALKKAKELGISQSRINEGFAFSKDADFAEIDKHLAIVKNNLQQPNANVKQQKTNVDAEVKAMAETVAEVYRTGNVL